MGQGWRHYTLLYKLLYTSSSPPPPTFPTFFVISISVRAWKPAAGAVISFQFAGSAAL